MASIKALSPALITCSSATTPITPSQTPSPIDASNPRQHLPYKTKTTQKNPSRPIRSRPRRERPCDACRRRKTRCVMVEGTTYCAFCQFHGKGCTFLQEPLPRTRKPKDTDETSEGVNSSSHPSPPATRRPSKIQTDSQSPSSQSHNSSRLQVPYPSAYSVSNPPCEADILQDTNFATDVFDAVNCKLDDTSYTLQGTSDQINALPQTSFNFEIQYEDELRILLAPYGNELVDLYFRFVHTDYPIINEGEFLTQVQELEICDRETVILFAAISLAALPFWNHSPSLTHMTPPQTQHLEELLYWSIFHFPSTTSLATIQAGLLLLHRPAFQKWSLTCQLVALGQDMELQLDCTRWNGITEMEKSVRKRTAWALYLHDKWSALIHGRPSHIRDGSDWTVPALESSDFQDFPVSLTEDEQDIELCIVFRRMVTLTTLVSSILSKVQCASLTHSPSSPDTDATRTILAAAKPIQMQLKSFFASLPSSCKMDNETSTSAIGSLHLAYYAAEITLHRRIISSLTANPDPYLSPILRFAAKSRLISAMDFVNRLRPYHLTSTFWYLPSTSNLTLVATFGNLLCSTSETEDESEFYSDRLREYRWTLGVSWGRAEWLSDAVELVDAQVMGSCDVQIPPPPSMTDGRVKQLTTVRTGAASPNGEQPHSSPVQAPHRQQPPQQVQHTSASLAELRVSLGLEKGDLIEAEQFDDGDFEGNMSLDIDMDLALSTVEDEEVHKSPLMRTSPSVGRAMVEVGV